MQTTIGAHIAEETLTRYVLGYLPEHLTIALEEHVLVCENCQLRLEVIDEHQHVGAAAAREIRHEEHKAASSSAFSWLFHVPKMAWGGAVAAVLICAAVPSYLRHPGKSTILKPTVEIALMSSRGAAQTLVSHADAGNVVLKIDVSELPVLPLYQVQVVNSIGSIIWSSSTAPIDRRLRIAIPHPFGPGQYWVRLFGSDQKQLREFGLNVE